MGILLWFQIHYSDALSVWYRNCPYSSARWANLSSSGRKFEPVQKVISAIRFRLQMHPFCCGYQNAEQLNYSILAQSLWGSCAVEEKAVERCRKSFQMEVPISLTQYGRSYIWFAAQCPTCPALDFLSVRAQETSPSPRIIGG